MVSKVVLITGANRGLGEGLVKLFLAEPNCTVIAANRDPSNAGSKALADLPKGTDSSLIVAKYEAATEQGAFNLVNELQTRHGIDHLDLVIANAGFAKLHPLVKDVKRADILDHIETNALGSVMLYQATRELLHKSSKRPLFAFMGSGAGALSRQPPVPNAAYGASKALLPWYAIRINAEDEWLISLVLDPGFVQTEMGNKGARAFGMEKAFDTVDDSVNGMFDVLSTATREKNGGKVVYFTGEILEW